MDEMMFKEHAVDSARILYTPSPFARTFLLYLQEAGQLQARTPHQNRRSNLDSYLFFTVLHGEGTLAYEGSTYPLQAGDCVLIDCRKPYAHATGDALWSLQWVHFNGPEMRGIYGKYCERGGKCVFHPERPEPYLGLLSAVYETAVSSDHVRDMRINELLAALLTLLMEVSWSPATARRVSAERQVLNRVKEYLDQNYAKKIALDDLAEQFFLNKFYLARIFKEQFGDSVVSYLTNLRIAHAKQLLRFSDLTMEKIGAACGMPDANYFSRVFRKVEGLSPREYRRQW